MGTEKIEQLREKANRLPLLPGVYIMLDSAGEVIYVGKAKLLKNRVTSYFRGEHLPKVAAMVAKVDDFNIIVTHSEFEALVLENSLIKRHRPYYNILLKDDKGYPFVRLDTGSAYPRFTIASRAANDGAKYYGPFGGRSVTRDIIDTVCKALRLPTCSRRFPRDIGRERPCLNYHLGSCAGYCLKDASAEEYRASIEQAKMIFEGKTRQLTAALEEEMAQAAENLQFERAAELRDRIRAIAGLGNRQLVISTAAADVDAVGFYRDVRCCFSVLHYSGGDLVGKDYELMEEPLEEDDEVVSALVRQYYGLRGAWPKTILLQCEIGDHDDLERLFAESAGFRVRIETPKRGERVRLVESALANAREESVRETSVLQRRSKVLEWLERTLVLPAFPERIEAIDVSNIGDFGIVAAITAFKNAKPLKRDYRKFKIRAVGHQDDYHSMEEALTRRFQRAKDGDEKFTALPDLLLVDGGAGHAAMAAELMERLGLAIPVYGMVKDDRHRTRALIAPDGSEIGISGNPAVFAFIGSVQDETHRVAIEFNRSLRSAAIGSTLDRIPGVGEKRRSALLKAFKTVKAVREAGFEQLCAVVPRNTARAVWDYFHKNEGKEPEACE